MRLIGAFLLLLMLASTSSAFASVTSQNTSYTWTSANLLNRTFAYDANGNVTQKDSAQFQYDPLDRLTWEPGQILQYDGNGNRLLDSAGPYSYTPASNRMATGPPGSVTLDAAGNTLAYAGQTFTYNQAGKLVSANGNASYTYRHDGLRASKTVSGVTTYFHYDLAGRLIAETDAAGVTLREYLWDDVAPVAQIAAGVITYLHTDHLGTPRLGTNSAGAQVWAWDSDAFGTTAQTGSVTVNLRFPGQYFDTETGLHQNWNRTYHPGLGRYLESDPIGLAGGVNTFGYVGQNPLRYVDPLGLDFTDSIKNWWERSVAGFKSESPADAAFRMLQGANPAAASVFGAVGGMLSRADKVVTACEVGGEAAKRAGRLGKQTTRQHIDEVATEMERRGWTITHGGGPSRNLKEEYLPGPGGARKGSSFPDITATKNGKTLRVNTVDTYANGVTPTAREARNAARIRAQTGEHLLLIPKP